MPAEIAVYPESIFMVAFLITKDLRIVSDAFLQLSVSSSFEKSSSSKERSHFVMENICWIPVIVFISFFCAFLVAKWPYKGSQ